MQTRNPTEHAEVLLKETSLPSHEIAKIQNHDFRSKTTPKIKSSENFKIRAEKIEEGGDGIHKINSLRLIMVLLSTKFMWKRCCQLEVHRI